MRTIKLKDKNDERLYPFTVADAVIGLTDKINDAIIANNEGDKNVDNKTPGFEDVPLGVLEQGTYRNSKFVGGSSTSVAMKSFFLLPYLGVTFNFKLPSNIVVDLYYGNYHGASGTTCYFGENVYSGISSGTNITFPNEILYTKEYGDDTDGDNAYYYGIVFKKTDNSNLTLKEIENYIYNGDIKITYPNPYGNIMERNNSSMDNVAASRMYFALGEPKRFNDVYLHISDLHGNVRGLLDCIELAKNIDAKAILLTGDVVPQSSKDNFDWLFHYTEDLEIPILWCTGNHDGVGMTLSNFNRAFYANSFYSDNNIGLGYHYCDIPNGNVRVIALDCSDTSASYRINSIGSAQISWLETTLTDAKNKGLGVIIIDHQPIGNMSKQDENHSKFCCENNNGNTFTGSDDVKDKVDDFINSGGEFIMYCNGHGHCDHAGWLPSTTNPQLHFNIASSTFATVSLNDDSPRNFGKGRAGDMINAYIIDRTKKSVTVVRFGGQLTTNDITRDRDTFSYVAYE